MAKSIRKCSTEDCENTHYGRGLCKKHYRTARSRGELPGQRSCSIDECENKAVARGWCEMHYKRWRTHGDPEKLHDKMSYLGKPCKVKGCNEMNHSRGMCRPHAERLVKYGDPLAGPPIQTKSRTPEEAFEKFTTWQGDCLVWTGGKVLGYGHIYVEGKQLKAHRFAWSKRNGPIPEGKEIDHVCHNTLCVNVKHLRLATPAQNSSNRSGAPRHSASGVRNVRPYKNRWQVNVKKKGKVHYFGIYNTIEEAAKVAEQARKQLFGEYAGKG